MVNNQLTQWVKDQKQKGFSKQIIQTHLQNQNYNQSDIIQAINLNFSNQINNTQTQQITTTNQSQKNKFNFKDMFKQPEHVTEKEEKESKLNLIFLIVTLVLTIIISIYFFKFK